jgi:ABC-type transporter Mla subunit MlaD
VTEIRREAREFREQNNRVLNAMREDLADLTSHANSLSSRVENGFAEMRGKLDAAAAGQDQIARLLSALIERENGPHDAR